MTAATLTTSQTETGTLRPVNLRTDLRAIADLLERCFSDEMDSGGRAAVRELRIFSRLPPLLWLLAGLNRMVKGLASGFVWVEDGRLVGNVSIYRTDPAWVIANVSVHPDYRRRGIARQLMHAGLERVRAYGAPYVDLQVRHENVPALALYRQLGFHERGTWITWRRAASLPPPKATHPQLAIREARRSEWRALYTLARQARPEGSLGWMRPLTPQTFQRSAWAEIWNALTGQEETHYLVPSASKDGPLDAALTVQQAMSRTTDRLTLLVHPDRRGELEEPLLRFALRRLEKAVVIEHTAPDTGALERLRFVRRQTLTHMRYRF